MKLLHQSEQRFRAVIEAVNGVLWITNATGEIVDEQVAWADLTGQNYEIYHHFGWTKALHADDIQPTLAAWHAALKDISPFTIEHRVYCSAGDWRYFTVRGTPVLGSEGNILEWVIVHIDITDAHATKLRLAKTAEHLSLALDAGQTGTWEINLLTGENIWDDRLFGLWGMIGPHAPSFAAILDIIHESDRSLVEANFAALRQSGNSGVLDIEFRITRANDGEERWLYAKGQVIKDDMPAQIILGATRDITDRKKRDGQIRFLMGELNHRTKNILAVVLAIARQTARHAPSLETFSDAFSDRITAMARSLDLLIEKNWSSASMLELVRLQTASVAGENGDRIKLSGSDVSLLPDAAQNLGLALHELSTNAAKHGALSIPGGHIALRWGIVDGVGNEKLFSLVWKELGGPPVTKPARRGFGHTVMNRLVKAALSGDAALEFEPDGVKWSVRIPVSQILTTVPPNLQA